jgi:xylulokinase
MKDQPGHVIGVDVGSQSVKAALLDPDGRVVATAGRPLVMSHPRAGWAEQDPADWEDALGGAVRAVVAAAGISPPDVTHLGLACQVDGVVAVDERLEPLRDAIIWLDRRAGAEVDVLTAAVGAEALFSTTGLNPDASHTAPKMMWLREHEPEVFAAARSLPPVAGFLLARLTGVLAQDPANASSTLLYDVATGTWSDTLVAAAGLDTALLPPIRPSTEVAGTLLPAAAELLGLSPGCRVVVGTGDEHAATLGAGAARPGRIVDVTGTAEPVCAVADTVVLDPERMVETHAHAVPGCLLVENPGFVSGGSTLWLAQSVLRVDQSAIFDLAADAPAGADGVVFLPALSGSMAPRWNEDMRGAFTGLAMNHDGRHLARAVLEGCAFALRDVVDRLDALGVGGGRDGEVRVVGGGARSPLWMQIKADVLGRPVRAVLAQEATATGAAFLAGSAARVFADLDDAVARAVEVAPAAVDPDPAVADRYDEAYERYRALFDAVEGCS